MTSTSPERATAPTKRVRIDALSIDARARVALSDEAVKLGNEAAKLGNDALRRLSREVEHRPLVTLAVAVGVGILVGLISQRR